MESNLRKGDEKGEKEIGKFLDLYFYPNYTINFQRIDNKELQVRGVDTLFSFNDKDVICDEKVALNYANKPLNTFAFELLFINRGGKTNIGWFLNKKKLTTHYLCGWIIKSDADKNISCEDVRQLEVGLISRKKLKSYFESIGWSEEKLSVKADKLNNNLQEYGGDMKVNGYRFHKSPQFVEAPVNLIVSKDILKTVSDGWWMIEN